MKHAFALFVTLSALAACGTVMEGPDLQPDGATPSADADPGIATLTVHETGTASGVVVSTPDGVRCGATCSAQFPVGTQITLVATPDDNATFAGWGGACSGADPTCTFTLTEHADVDAGFAVAVHTVTVELTGNGVGVVSSSAGGIACPGTCATTVPHGTELVLTAAPQGVSSFVGWSGGGCTGEGACTVAVTGDVTINAAFALNHTLVVTRIGNGTGTVTSSPGGITCGADCDEVYGAGAAVTLAAAPAATSIFAGWTGGGCTGTGDCTVTLDAAVGVSATFTLRTYTLAVTTTGAGSGVVTSSPAGIVCPGDCSNLYDHGTSVVLVATPDAHSTFAGWSGACSGTGPCTVAMTQARNATATFALQSFALTVDRAGGGNGTVTSAPAGITCGTDCSQSYAFGTMVTLTASPAAGSTFSGWTGPCSGTGTCTLTIAAAATVGATFDAMFVVEPEQGGGNGTMIALGTATNRACFLSGTAGQYGIGGGDARVFVSGGQWYLSVTGLIDGYAQCIAWPSTTGMVLDIEYPWVQGQAAVDMGAAAHRFCGLTRMAGHYNGGGELIWADMIGGEWMLHGTGFTGDVTAGARCVTWPATTGLSYTGESLWAQGAPGVPVSDVDLGPVGVRACVFTLITGAYIGGGENVHVRRSGGAWGQGGASQQNGVATRARCLTGP